MRNIFIIFVCINAVLLDACNHFTLLDLFPASSAQTGNPEETGSNGDYSTLISIDTANRMIKSYLNSIDYKVNTKEIRSWSFNANVLRTYLNSEKGKDITDVRFFLAHTMSYIMSGHEGQRLPDDSHGLTLIIIGVDSTGKEVYTTLNKAYNHCMPCPEKCYNGDLLHNQ